MKGKINDGERGNQRKQLVDYRKEIRGRSSDHFPGKTARWKPVESEKVGKSQREKRTRNELSAKRCKATEDT